MAPPGGNDVIQAFHNPRMQTSQIFVIKVQVLMVTSVTKGGTQKMPKKI
jgi:hypothetical protein